MKWEEKKKLKNYFLRAQRRFDGDFISRESLYHGHMIFYDRWKEIIFRHFRISTKRQLNCYSKVENAAFSCKHRRSFARKEQRRWRVAHIFFSFISQTQSRSHCRPINVLSRLQRLDELENLSQQRTMNDAERRRKKKMRKSRPIAMVVDVDSDVK